MKTLPAELTTELAKSVNSIRHLFEIVLDSGTYRYTDAGLDINYESGYTGFSEVVLNPGFETLGGGGADVFASWTEATVGTSTISADAAEKRSGTYCAKLSIAAGGDIAYVKQNFTLTEGATYRLSFWYKNSIAGKTCRPDFRINGSTKFLDDDGSWITSAFHELTCANSLVWVQKTVTFVASEGTLYQLYLTGEAGAASSDVYFDDVSLTRVGVWWATKGIEFDSAKYSASPKADTIRFSIDNVDRVWSAKLMAEETRGKEVTIYRVALDRNMRVLGEAVILFYGFLDSFEADNQRVTFDVFNHFIRWKMLSPRRFHQANCGWTFKKVPTCDYAGIASAHRARTSNVATIATTLTHGMLTGDTVTISGMGGTGYNGTFTVASVPDTTHFTFANAGGDEVETVDAGGTISVDWCDHSWERCEALHNTNHFGGFKWLPFLAEKKIWWGKVPK